MEKNMGFIGFKRYGLNLEIFNEWMNKHTWQLLKNTSEGKRMALKHNNQHVFNNTSIKNEIDWLLEKVFISRIDKTINNI